MTVAGLAAAREIAKDIKLSHSVFALPFALLGAFVALPTGPIDWRGLLLSGLLVVGCMVSARTAAMVANRLLDRGIDARNPRTVSRALPAGRVAVWQVRAALLAASAAFVMLCGLFGVLQQNWWPLALALPVLFWICSYGLFKRFTMLCHVWLGASLAISPVAAALAVRPAAVLESGPWLLAGAVLFWVAGFDVLYAMQDVEVDRRDGLHSMPARMGVQRAAWASRVMHVASVMLLVAFWRAEPALCAGTGFAAAVVVAAVVIASEHVLLARGGAAGIAKHFTTLNGIVSLALGGAGIASIIAARG